MAVSRSKTRKGRTSSARYKKPAKRVDKRQATLFFGTIITLIIIVIIGTYYFTLSDDDDDKDAKDNKDSLSLYCYNPEHDITENGTAQFVFILENKAEDKNVAKIEITEKPENWDVHLDQEMAILQKGTRKLIILTVKAPEGVDSGEFPIKVSSSSLSFKGLTNSSKVKVEAKPQTTDRTVEKGDHIYVDYVGYLADGKIFDTSVESVAKNNSVPKTEDFSVRNSYSPLDFDAGEGNMIKGFDEGVMGMSLVETRIIIVPPDKGYSTDDKHPLYGKTLYFEVTLVNID